MPRLNLPQKSISQLMPNPAFKANDVVSDAPDLHLPCAEHLAGCLLHLRVERAAGDPELGARFHDAQTGDPHVGIHALRLGNQLVEHGIVEVAPPLLRLSAARHPRVSGQRLERATRPVGQPGHLRALEVGPHRRAGAEQHGACKARQPHAQPVHVRHDERVGLAFLQQVIGAQFDARPRKDHPSKTARAQSPLSDRLARHPQPSQR